VYNIAAIKMHAAGAFKDVDLTKYTQCIKTIESDEISGEMITYIKAAFDAKSNKQYQDAGHYLGLIANRLCTVQVTLKQGWWSGLSTVCWQ